MLSDRERETLREIQRQLATEDPALASNLDRVEPSAPPGLGRGGYLAALIASLLFMFVLLGAQSGLGTLIFMAAAAVSGVLFYRADREVPRSP